MYAIRYDNQEVVSLLRTKSEVDSVSRETVCLHILTSAMLVITYYHRQRRLNCCGHMRLRIRT